MKTAAAYIRVSTEEQAEYSPQSQLKKIRDYAEKNGYYLPEEFVFCDEGISGKSTKKRDAFNRMIALAGKSPRAFDAILVWKFSRFARSREDSVVYKSMLRKKYGIRVVSVSEDVGDDKMSVIFESMIEAMDEYYSINLAEEVRRGMAERIREGKHCARAPFGYAIKDGGFSVLADEARIIRLVFEAFSNGESVVGIARQLNAIGVRTHRGNKIENRTVEYWLKNPVYVGRLRWKSGEKIITACGGHEAIINDSLWESVQQRLKRRTKRREYELAAPSSWLVGILKCGICGGAMVNSGGYFYCGNKIKGSCAGCGGVNAKKLECAVAEQIAKVAYDAELEFLPTNHETMTAQQVEYAKKRLDRIKSAYEAGVDSLEEYSRSKASILAQLEELKKGEVEVQEPKQRCIVEILTAEDVSTVAKCAAARAVISHITKNGGGYDIFLNLCTKEDQMEN